MIGIEEASLHKLSIHQAGNKGLNQPLRLSQNPYELSDEMLHSLLAAYFLKPFQKVNSVYRFFQVNQHLHLNPVYQYTSAIFDDRSRFHEFSCDITRHLYESADHPRIKPGEFYVVYIKDLFYNGEATDAVGLFKSESKEPYLNVTAAESGFDIEYREQAINLKKVDKGCIIFNTSADTGFDVLVIDQTNTEETVYWVDKFLGLKQKQNEFAQTNQLLDAYRSFISEELPKAMDLKRTDQIDLLNRSIRYFKEKEEFRLQEFADEVLANDEAIERFSDFRKRYENDFELTLDDSFPISETATRKQVRMFRSVLKLDRNFHVYIHGNTELIEKGFDEQKRKSYYKIYFDEEH
ncbi:MAG TPA: nucleoid-associated protein [Chitinophagaceae bacterium]